MSLHRRFAHDVGQTLEEAQNEEFVEIVAAWLDAPRKTFSIDAAQTLCEALRTHDDIMSANPRTTDCSKSDGVATIRVEVHYKRQCGKTYFDSTPALATEP